MAMTVETALLKATNKDTARIDGAIAAATVAAKAMDVYTTPDTILMLALYIATQDADERKTPNRTYA